MAQQVRLASAGGLRVLMTAVEAVRDTPVNLTQRPAESRELADDEAVAALQGARESSEDAAVSRRACPEAVASMNSSMRKSCARAYSRVRAPGGRRWGTA